MSEEAFIYEAIRTPAEGQERRPDRGQTLNLVTGLINELPQPSPQPRREHGPAMSSWAASRRR